jgi:hypothetical protein
MPVAGRIIGAEGDAALFAGFGEFLDHVPLEGRVHDVVVGLFGVPEAEAVVVFGGEHHVFHAGGLGDGDPFIGVELGGVEAFVEVVVFLDGVCAPRDQPISWPVRATGPQWMNMPKRASRQFSRASGWTGVMSWAGRLAAAEVRSGEEE